MNFKEPISTFAYNLISLHHDIMWYIIIIISLVYWTLYKIIKEYSWNIFNKQEGFILLSYYKILVKIQIYILFVWYSIFSLIIIKSFNIFLLFIKSLDKSIIKKKKYINILLFIVGKNYYKGFYNNFYINNWNFLYFKNLIIERFLASYLFNKSTNALYYYEGYDNILNTLKFKHSMNMEYVFGFFPTIIIALIIVPSMYLLYSNESEINPCLTIKVMGHQWYWSYQSTSYFYLKNSNKMFLMDYSYDSIIINEEDLIKGSRRLLETDKALVLPYNTIIRFLISSTDVLHAWAVPELGIKVDAVPGRLNQAITIPNNLGIYYGQCSELCGISHGFMPIKINIIALSDYYKWIKEKK